MIITRYSSGYIGGTVLKRLLEHSDVASFTITALVRSEDKAKKLSELGVKTVLGAHENLDLLENVASQSDFVFAMVSSTSSQTPDGNALHDRPTAMI